MVTVPIYYVDANSVRVRCPFMDRLFWWLATILYIVIFVATVGWYLVVTALAFDPAPRLLGRKCDAGILVVSGAAFLALAIQIWLGYREEWFRGEFIITNEGIRKKMPSGKEQFGFWSELVKVNFLTRNLSFRDGTCIRMGFFSAFDPQILRQIAVLAGETNVYTKKYRELGGSLDGPPNQN